MRREEIRLTVVSGLASALVIVILGVLDVLTLALFCGVLLAGGIISALGATINAAFGDPSPAVQWRLQDRVGPPELEAMPVPEVEAEELEAEEDPETRSRHPQPLSERVELMRLIIDMRLLAGAKVPSLAIGASGGATFAGVNGAILAIAFAAITGYALIVFQSIDRMLHELVDKANDVIELDRAMGGGPEASLAEASGDDLLDIVQNAALGIPIKLGPGEEISATDLARRGRVFVWGMEKLFLCPTKANRRAMSPIRFSNGAKLRYP